MRLVSTFFAVLSACALAQTPAAWEEPLARHEWDKAESLLKAALAQDETASILRGLATVYRSTGRIEAADPVLERLVALDGSFTNIEDLARIKTSLGYLDRAEILYRSALALRLEGNTDISASLAVRTRLTQVLVAEKKFPEAEQEAVSVIALRSRTLGPNHPDLAADNALLARIFQVQKKWREATATWETVATIQAGAFGYEDLRLADTLDSLADCRFEIQLADTAIDALRQALAIRELNLGASNGEVAATTDHLAKLLFSAKRFDEAELYFERTLSIYLSLLGPDSPELARAYDNLAVTEAMLEKYAESEDLYRQALRLRDRDDVLSLRNLALVLTAQNKNVEAQRLYSRALAVLDNADSPDPEFLKVILTEYSGVLRDLKRPAEAKRLEQRLKQPGVRAKPAPVAAKQ